MLRHAADKGIGDEAGSAPLTFPNRDHARGEQPAIERAQRCGIRIGTNPAMLEQDFVAHQLGDTVPTAAVAVDLICRWLRHGTRSRLGVAPQSKFPCGVIIAPTGDVVIRPFALVANPNDVDDPGNI